MNATYYSEKLFSYGTLQFESVQLSTFGRKLNGVNDVLAGYYFSQLKITNPDVIKASGMAVHPVLMRTGNEKDEVDGMVFDITPQELAQADQYEEKDYKRVSVQLRSGVQAWVYVAK
jgi:gamma-glutamylcyclotransferase (GGCT)/AIG2-like uncharacterized protein YtfP